MTVEYGRQKVKLETEIVDDGWWHLDKVTGKKLMIMHIVNKEHGLKYSNYCPTTADIVEIIDKYLEAEKANDEFKFADGSTRPTEIHKKIKELKDAIAKHEHTRMDEIF